MSATPAERLIAAADLLDKQAGEATEGPWWNEAGPATGLDVVQGGMVAQDLWLKVAGYVRPQDATYIATMHPEVGKFLVEWLREEAAEARIYRGANPEHLFRHALGFADLLLAGAS